MTEEFCRGELLLGEGSTDFLNKCTVAVFGVGGVGGYVVESIARSGVGNIVLVDSDTVSVSNINRQIIALQSTIGKAKVDVMKQRILDINPKANVTVHCEFFLPENADNFDFKTYDYVVDAIDTVTAKLSLIEKCKEFNVPIISSMGCGNKLDPTKFQIADIKKTTICPLAKVMRRELKARNIIKVKVLFSTELAIKPVVTNQSQVQDGRRTTPGSVSFVPGVAGLIIGGEVIKDLLKLKEEK